MKATCAWNWRRLLAFILNPSAIKCNKAEDDGPPEYAIRTRSPRPNTFDFDNVERNLWMKNSSKHFLNEFSSILVELINSPTHRISNSHDYTCILIATHTFSTDWCSRKNSDVPEKISNRIHTNLFVAACNAWNASSSSSFLWHISARQRDVQIFIFVCSRILLYV